MSHQSDDKQVDYFLPRHQKARHYCPWNESSDQEKALNQQDLHKPKRCDMQESSNRLHQYLEWAWNMLHGGVVKEGMRVAP